MNTKSKTIIVGTGGFFAGLFVSTLVTWNILPKACLAGGVCLIVSILLYYVLPKPKSN